ncbi:MAG: type II secretion system protein GspG [Myxococcales bacterium]|nr:type II secretion system protein GspG [Myxococcales bacterium]MCB9628037.1 type II secretion system protein GspG [Sandaracinaceae bacterium]
MNAPSNLPLRLNTPRFARSTRTARARRTLGMTLVEIMIVVVIMALMATAVGVAVIPRLKAARITQTRTDAQTVASAAMQYIIENPGEGCPTIQELSGGYLSSSTRLKDAWDNDFAIECSGDEVNVRSAGPDGNMGTEDDI